MGGLGFRSCSGRGCSIPRRSGAAFVPLLPVWGSAVEHGIQALCIVEGRNVKYPKAMFPRDGTFRICLSTGSSGLHLEYLSVVQIRCVRELLDNSRMDVLSRARIGILSLR